MPEVHVGAWSAGKKTMLHLHVTNRSASRRCQSRLDVRNQVTNQALNAFERQFMLARMMPRSCSSWRVTSFAQLKLLDWPA